MVSNNGIDRIRCWVRWVACFLVMVGATACMADEPAGDMSRSGSLPQESAMTGFAKLKAKADAGERLNVVFLGGSLTWGANASDPQVTSYRALVSQRLLDVFPKSQIRFHDAAIGGTGSQLGIFRLDRDVLAHEPDLVFLDFTANDDIRDADPHKMASYETLVRRIIDEGHAPLVIMIFPFDWDAKQGNTDKMPGRDATIEVANTYNVPVGDAVVGMQQRIAAGELTVKEAWPHDGVHPGDRGYAVFADVAMEALGKGLDERAAMRLPDEPLHGNAYAKVARVRLADSAESLPAGWQVGTPSLIAAWYDGLMSRWLDRVIIAGGKGAKARPEPLRLTFHGSSVHLFGEQLVDGGKYRVTIDGELQKTSRDAEAFDTSSKRHGGNLQHYAEIARGLDEREPHTLVIEPLLADGQQLRIESICVAGAKQPGAEILTD